MNPARLISQRAQAIEASGIRKIFDLAATLKDPINLSIGQPDFETPELVQSAAIEAIRSGFNRYTPSGGISELKDLVLNQFEQTHRVRPEDAMITSGVSGALTLALLALVNPGDEVLMPDPYFVSYKHLTSMSGGQPVYYDTYPHFQIDVGRLEGQVSSKTKAILAMSPGNPTGVGIPLAVKKDLADLAKRKGLILISDEIYESFSYGDHSPTSLAVHYPEGALIVGGLSKTVAVTGWRLGWALGPRFLIQEMTKLQQFTFVCAPSFAQRAALKAFDVDLSDTVAAYRGKRDLMVSGLREIGYEVVEPDGAFYLFIKVPLGYENGQAFVEAAAQKNLLMVAGNVFSERDTHFRISFAAPNEKLEQGRKILRELFQPNARSTI